jgi:DNA-binding HxlR family transcriptional regulator
MTASDNDDESHSPFTPKRNTGCPIAYALDHFGDKWSLIIIRDLLLKGHETYGQFLLGDERIATNILANRLKHLEEAGLVYKHRNAQNRRSNIYGLTEKGLDLAPLMLELIRWSAAYDPKSKANPKIVARIETDREGLLADILKKTAQKRD